MEFPIRSERLDQILTAARQLVSCEPDELVRKYLESHPRYQSPDYERIVPSGTPVWAVIAYLPTVDWDLVQAARDYAIPLEAVIAALYYYSKNTSAIDHRIASNYSRIGA